MLKQVLAQTKAITAVKDRPVPMVLATDEVSELPVRLLGLPRTIAKLRYGCGMWISEAPRLQVEDVGLLNQ